jgi:exonuclease SbcC
MITKLSLINFQSHRDTVLEFSPGVNAIVGQSDSGKSAILRALYWIKNNRPSGDAFVSHWARNGRGIQIEETSAGIEIGDTAIARIRGKTLNAYRINGKDLEAVRTDVPAEVAAALRLSDVNVQRQLDSPFLLGESPADVARFFNELVHLDEIDAALTIIESKKRETAADGRRWTAEIEGLEKTLKDLSWVPAAAVSFERVQSVREALRENKDKRAKILPTLTQYRTAAALRATYRPILRGAAAIEGIDALKRERDAARADVARLRSEKEAFVAAVDARNRVATLAAAGAVLERADKLRDMLKNKKAEQERVAESARKYRHNAIARMTILNEEIPMLEQELPEVCPTCGQEILK